MATRTQSREAVVAVLYALESGNDDALAQAGEFFFERKIRNKQADFAMGLLNGIVALKEQLDAVIVAHLKGWEMERLGVAERCILRLGAYEILESGLDLAVVVNECVELCKHYGDDEAPKLINGVLDSVGKNRGKLSLKEMAQNPPLRAVGKANGEPRSINSIKQRRRVESLEESTSGLPRDGYAIARNDDSKKPTRATNSQKPTKRATDSKKPKKRATDSKKPKKESTTKSKPKKAQK